MAPRQSPLERNQTLIIKRLHARENRVFTEVELRKFLAELREEVALPRRITLPIFLSFLTERCSVRRVELVSQGKSKAGEPYKTIVKYLYDSVSPFTLGLALRSGSYLTHATAMFLHSLTVQVPKTIYVNKEQTPKPHPTGDLSQPGIDRAFSNKARVSNFVFAAEGHRYVILSGKNTGRLEVSQLVGPNGESLDATKLERTLIDIAVRPSYAGGPHEVLRAYHQAKDRVSVAVLLATLRKLDYVYPYHQAIGFYMERAGYKAEQLGRLKAVGINYDFYLANAMKDREFDSSWRIHYPKGF